jgi:uncharacterized protein
LESIILRKVIYFFLLICSLDPIGAKADVSFDCRTAKVTAEKLVCDNKTLSDLDGELGRIYRLIMHGKNASIADKKILKASQRGWIKGRNDCWKSVSELTCILSSYVVRISELRIGYVDARKTSAMVRLDLPVREQKNNFGLRNCIPTSVLLQL